ncbi:hypothetical protein BJX99DRAFT_261556 [Aspergillus californicus]
MPESNPDVISLIRQNQPVTPVAVENYYNSLAAVSLDSLLGEWHGTCVLTGHPGTKSLIDVRWTGKNFHSVDNVDPIIVKDEKEGRAVNGFMGKARIREVKYNGVVSAAMIYNEKPIIDYFRAVDGETVMGVMDALGSTADHSLYFILERLGGGGRL